MSRFRTSLTGREAYRSQRFAYRRKGAGWTRKFRKGRSQRHPFHTNAEPVGDSAPVAAESESGSVTPEEEA